MKSLVEVYPAIHASTEKGGSYCGLDNQFVSDFIVTMATSSRAEFLGNSVSREIREGGTRIVASFTPSFGLSISEAASLLGYSGFNWIQKVVNDPYPLSSTLAPDKPLTVPYFDPPLGGYATKPETAVNYPYYYNQSLLYGNQYVIGENESILTECTLKFSDVPSEPLLKSGEFLGFETYLIGILPGGGFDVLYKMDWKSNYGGRVKGGGVFGVRSNLDSAVPGTGSGGIELLDEEYLDGPIRPSLGTYDEKTPPAGVIPEPGMLFLVASGCILLLAGSRRFCGPA